MRLISVYIENFGGLSQYTLRFGEGLTTVLKPNGFGKTTLAEFIRAMFYGFPRKSKNLDKSLRQKYAPWNGGRYGGYLEFEHEGQSYRMERTFGINPKGDTLSVIDLNTNRKTARFGEEPGQELFGLDAESFERSTYFPQQRSEAPLTTASIRAKLSNLVEDSADVGNYDQALAALRASRSDLIPYRGNGGTVAESVAEITRLQLQLEELTAQEALLQQLLETAEQARHDSEAIKEQLDRLAEELETASRRETVSVLQQQYQQLQLRHRKISERLAFYRGIYPDGLPEEQQLQRIEIASQQFADAGKAGAYPSQAQLEHCRQQYEEYSRLQRELRLLQQRMEESRQRGKKIPLFLAWMLSTVSFIAAAALLLLQKTPYAFSVFGIGAVALATGILLLWRHNRKKRGQLALQKQADALKRAAEQYRAQVAAFLAPFHPDAQPYDYGTILTQLQQRMLQQKSYEDAAQKEVTAFLERLGYSKTQDIQACLQQLRADIHDIQAAKTLLRELEDQLAAMEAAYAEELFAEPVSAPDLRQLRAEDQSLREAQKDAMARLLQAQQSAQLLRRQTVEIPQLREKLERYRQKLEKDRSDARTLDRTIEFLQQARENLATAYMGTIRSRFGHYLTLLGCGDEQYFVDSDLQIQLQRQGQARSLAYFSAGQTDLVMLCMRLSLVDALFRNREMFIILDDPFVNLDDQRMEQARHLLQKLACEKQILYFTCHSGRIV